MQKLRIRKSLIERLRVCGWFLIVAGVCNFVVWWMGWIHWEKFERTTVRFVVLTAAVVALVLTAYVFAVGRPAQKGVALLLAGLPVLSLLIFLSRLAELGLLE